MNALGRAQWQLTAAAFLLGAQLALVARTQRNLDRVAREWRAERARTARALDDIEDAARRVFVAPEHGPAELEHRVQGLERRGYAEARLVDELADAVELP